ncbi:MAG: hypothetical protein ACYTJ0_18250 [Planctomycetota bacterium]|jgi:hypothetical protein
MGQLALGLRSLVIKSGVFFVMAALLAWALGGTLWPRDEQIDFESTAFDGQQWYWQLVVSGRTPRQATWRLMSREGGEEPRPVDDQRWEEVAGPLVAGEAMYYGGRTVGDRPAGWQIVVHRGAGAPRIHPLPDRLAVERQLARLRAGLELQDERTVADERSRVLDPGRPGAGPPAETGS